MSTVIFFDLLAALAFGAIGLALRWDLAKKA